MINRREIIATLGRAGLGLYGAHILGACGAEKNTGAVSVPWPKLDAPPILEGDTNQPWWARGNYAPVLDEIESFELEVFGSIPPELNGFFVRNGPNSNTSIPQFWFFGDGMLHGVELSNGQAKSYRNKWIQTPAYMSGQGGLFSNYGNTSLVHHGGRLLALYEQGEPYEIGLPNLETVGTFDFGGELNGSVTAHPKIDPLTGELHFFGYSPIPPYLQYYVATANGQMLKRVNVSIPRGVMMHDFQLTDRHAIFFDLPVVFRPTPGATFPIAFDRELGARIGLLSRTDDSQINWFEIEPCYLFHTFNAFEQDGKVIIEGCRLEEFSIEGTSPHLPAGTAWRWTIDTENNHVSESPIFDSKVDFPAIDIRRQGSSNQISYALSLVEPNDDYPLHPNGIVKFDRLSERLNFWTSGYGAQPDEAVFVAAPNAEGEDEGWLLSMVYNRVDEVSEMVIIDAQALERGPVAKIRMPRRVPFGFHGTWVPRVVL